MLWTHKNKKCEDIKQTSQAGGSEAAWQAIRFSSRVAPDLLVGMRRVFTDTSGGRARPSKRFCPPLTHSPHSDLSHPPNGFRCAAKKHLWSISGWQSRDASDFLPLLPVPSSTAARVIGDTFGFLPQPTGPILATIQPTNKDANDFPLWWMTSPPSDLFDTPTQVCLPDRNTPVPLSHFSHECEHLPGVSSWILRTVRSGYTLQFGCNPPASTGFTRQ